MSLKTHGLRNLMKMCENNVSWGSSKTYYLCFDNGILYFDIKVCIFNFEDFYIIILYDCHHILILGHLGFQKT
jgi:hypothetical protein